MKCPLCGADLLKRPNKGTGCNSTKFHCPTATCPLTFIRRQRIPHTRRYIDTPIYAAVT